jgi:hypothetical protein
LSEFKVNTSTENGEPVPLFNCIGIVLPEYSIKPVVDGGMVSIDQDRTVCESLRYVHSLYDDGYTKLIFANGGDQNNDTIPERAVCEELGIELADGLGDKIQSSSWLLNK